jgi:hypothetical protein
MEGIGSYLFLLGPAAILGGGCYVLYLTIPRLLSAVRLAFRGEKATGLVVGVRTSKSRGYDPVLERRETTVTRHHTITFRTGEGASFTFDYTKGSLEPSFERRERVGVLYDLRNPQSAQVGSSMVLWGTPFVGLLLAGVLIFFGIWFALRILA